jgi:hypothetical protein
MEREVREEQDRAHKSESHEHHDVHIGSLLTEEGDCPRGEQNCQWFDHQPFGILRGYDKF